MTQRSTRVGEPAPDIEGVDLSGRHVRVHLSGVNGERRALLFLTSACETCRPMWRSAPGARGLTVVTPDPATEDARELSRLATGQLELAMSSKAWFLYGVPGSPWLVVVDSGRVVVDVAPGTWEDVAAALGLAAP